MTDPDQQIWDAMLAHLRAHRATLCRQWFQQLEPLGVSGGALNLRAHSILHRNYLRQQCADAFNDAARTVSGRLLSVRFLGPEDEPAPSPPRDNGRKTPGQMIEPRPEGPGDGLAAHNGVGRSEPFDRPALRHDESLVINPDYAFENFVEGPGNRLALAAARAVSANPGRAYNPLFIHGGVGLGKTHLLQAVCLKIAEQSPRAVMYYISCEGFITQFMESVQSGEMTQFRHRFRDVDVLVIDDIHFLAKRDRTQEEFFHTFNSLYHANKQIILSSDAPPEEIPDLEQRLVSRFMWGLVAKMDPPCYETRVAILKTKSRLRGIELPDDVACYIAARIDTNIRELEGAITRLQIQATVENRPLDLELARAAMGDTSAQIVSEPTIQSIINAVTDFYGVRLTDLQSKRRQRSVALPRQVCMFLARRHTRHSLEEIGGYFGGRDHTTVMHAIRTIEARHQAETEFQVIIKTLEERIQAGRL
ncbi:MAG: chromosomal replication initiator protein DnaA [Phycisphaerales bacterium]|nr:chromosomal replication initiator protein DnaA [Phycisphaerales bacterium]